MAHLVSAGPAVMRRATNNRASVPAVFFNVNWLARFANPLLKCSRAAGPALKRIVAPSWAFSFGLRHFANSWHELQFGVERNCALALLENSNRFIYFPQVLIQKQLQDLR